MHAHELNFRTTDDSSEQPRTVLSTRGDQTRGIVVSRPLAFVPEGILVTHHQSCMRLGSRWQMQIAIANSPVAGIAAQEQHILALNEYPPVVQVELLLRPILVVTDT